METKVPFYSIINILVPGLIFIGAGVFAFFNEVEEMVVRIAALDNMGFEILLTVASLAVAYEVGYVIFRLGAAIIEPLLQKMFGWATYENFAAAKRAGAKSLDMLSREYGYSRTHISLFIALAILMGVRGHWIIVIFCIACVVLFVLAARSYIKKTIDTVNIYLKPQIESEGVK